LFASITVQYFHCVFSYNFYTDGGLEFVESMSYIHGSHGVRLRTLEPVSLPADER